jgi:hypothetical protein
MPRAIDGAAQKIVSVVQRKILESAGFDEEKYKKCIHGMAALATSADMMMDCPCGGRKDILGWRTR